MNQLIVAYHAVARGSVTLSPNWPSTAWWRRRRCAAGAPAPATRWPTGWPRAATPCSGSTVRRPPPREAAAGPRRRAASRRSPCATPPAGSRASTRRQRLPGRAPARVARPSPQPTAVRRAGHDAGRDPARDMDGAVPSGHVDSGRRPAFHRHAEPGGDTQRLSRQARGARHAAAMRGRGRVAAAAPAPDPGRGPALRIRPEKPRRPDHVPADRRNPPGAGAAAQSPLPRRRAAGQPLPALHRAADGAGHDRSVEPGAGPEPPHLHPALPAGDRSHFFRLAAACLPAIGRCLACWVARP